MKYLLGLLVTGYILYRIYNDLVEAIGVDGKGSLLVSLMGKYLLVFKIMPFELHHIRMKELNQFVNAICSNIMAQRMDGFEEEEEEDDYPS